MNEQNAKKLLFTVSDVLKEAGLKHMLYGGTCLGAVREKRFIPIDLDVDVSTRLEWLVPLAKEIDVGFKAAGLKTEVIDHRHFASWDGSVYAIKYEGFGEHGDLTGFKLYKGKRVIPSHADKHWLVHDAKYFEEWRRVKFYGQYFHVPKDTDGFLTEKYGDWQTPHEKFYNVSKCRVNKLW